MLLYVDKKKQRRQKIKVLSFIFACSFIVLANIIHYKNSLHKSQASITDYQNIQTTHDWFYTSDTIQIFTKKNQTNPLIIITPQTITKENAQIIAYALSNQKPDTSIRLSQSLTNNQILKSLIQYFEKASIKSNNNPLLITNNITEAKEIIYKEKLHPHFLTYKKSQNIIKTTEIKQLLDKIFPPIQKPTTNLEQELFSLKDFASKYKTDIINSFSNNHKHNFTIHGLFLKNANICINNQNQKICQIANNNSFEKNIKNILAKNTIDNITQINLLTSLQEISSDDLLEKDEGIIFQFENRREILLPYEIKKISAINNPFHIIKNNLGINPKYTSPKMKFFKFKTLEINLNDKI